MAFAVQNLSYSSTLFAGEKYLQCGDADRFAYNYRNETEYMSKVTWCHNYCRECYKDPKGQLIVFTAITDYDETDTFSLTIIFSQLSTILFVFGFYFFHWASLRYKSLRKYVLLPVLQPVMEVLIVLYTSLFFFLLIMTLNRKRTTPDYAVCCTSSFLNTSTYNTHAQQQQQQQQARRAPQLVS
jgi:hypothetical protein